ncbi:MAG TPA: outer membrane beta-barrel protein [Methylocella sp.]|nr:outer membrane beta-barrel protein [Methylocella sp.]
MSRKIFLIPLVAMAFSGSSALASDLTPPPPFTWAGIYVGGQAGYAWGTGNLNYNAFDPVDSVYSIGGVANDFKGVIGGGHVGYNFQIDRLVFGLEGTFDGTSLRNSATSNLFAFQGSTLSASSNSSVQGAILGRAGVAFDRALIYATAGIAFATFQNSYSFIGNLNGSPLINGGNTFSASSIFSNTRTGWTVGAGVDYALDDKWSVFAEYRYTGFGTYSSSGLTAEGFITAPALTNALLNVHRTLNQSQVQVGFSYNFGNYTPAGALENLGPSVAGSYH